MGRNVPAVTPTAIIDALNHAANQVLADTRVREKMLAMTVERVGGTAKAYAEFLAAEYDKWGRIIKEGNIVLRE